MKIAEGATWMVLFKLVDRSLGIVSMLILARLLIPTDFGIVAMGMSVIALIELSSAFNLDVPLIQRANPEREHFDTAWTLNVLFGVGCALATAIMAVPAASFYGEPRLVPVMLVLASGWLFQGFENIGVVNFRRSMNFRREVGFLFSKKLAAFLVTVILAVLLDSYWALVAGVLAGRISGVVLSYVMEPFRPRFSLSKRSDLFSISGWLFVNNLLSFANQRISHFILGRLFGAQSLGYYTISTELAYLPQNEMIAPINRAVFPGYAQMLRVADEMRRGFLDVNAVIAAFVFPASVGVAVTAEYLVAVLLGSKWMEAVPLIQVLALAGGMAALMSNTYSAYLALGKAYVATALLAVELVILIAAIFLFSRTHGLMGIAYAELTAVTIGTMCSFPVLFRTLKISVGSYLMNVWRPILASAAMGLLVIDIDRLIGGGAGSTPPLINLLVMASSGILIYVLALLLLWLISGRPDGAEKLVLNHLRTRLRWPALSSR